MGQFRWSFVGVTCGKSMSETSIRGYNEQMLDCAKCASFLAHERIQSYSLLIKSVDCVILQPFHSKIQVPLLVWVVMVVKLAMHGWQR